MNIWMSHAEPEKDCEGIRIQLQHLGLFAVLFSKFNWINVEHNPNK